MYITHVKAVLCLPSFSQTHTRRYFLCLQKLEIKPATTSQATFAKPATMKIYVLFLAALSALDIALASPVAKPSANLSARGIVDQITTHECMVRFGSRLSTSSLVRDRVLTSKQRTCLHVGNFHIEDSSRHEVCDSFVGKMWTQKQVTYCVRDTCPRSQWKDVTRGNAMQLHTVMIVLTRSRVSTVLWHSLMLVVHSDLLTA